MDCDWLLPILAGLVLGLFAPILVDMLIRPKKER